MTPSYPTIPAYQIPHPEPVVQQVPLPLYDSDESPPHVPIEEDEEFVLDLN